MTISEKRELGLHKNESNSLMKQSFKGSYSGNKDPSVHKQLVASEMKRKSSLVVIPGSEEEFPIDPEEHHQNGVSVHENPMFHVDEDSLMGVSKLVSQNEEMQL